MLVSIQGVSGWTLQNWSLIPDQEQISPGTPMTVNYIIHFNSLDTGETFPSKNTLDMYTDLANPQWVVTKTDPVEDRPPVTTPLLVKQASLARIDGWALSYARRQFDANVQLKGEAPPVDQSQNKILFRLQELDSYAKPVSGTLIKKEFQVYVPEPTPATITPAPTQKPTDTVQSPTTLTTSSVPTKKQTYSPGPEPLVICGVLLTLVFTKGIHRKK
jgi:hypothetical protein